MEHGFLTISSQVTGVCEKEIKEAGWERDSAALHLSESAKLCKFPAIVQSYKMLRLSLGSASGPHGTSVFHII